jgi:hypothetical protein
MKRAFTVYYREQDGEVGDIDFSEDFNRESTLMQADVIGDLIQDLTKRYNRYIQRGVVGGERRLKSCQANTEHIHHTPRKSRQQPVISP